MRACKTSKAGVPGIIASLAVACVWLAGLGVPEAMAQDAGRIAAAKAKGKIVWYTSVFPEELRNEYAADFRKRTGLDLQIGYVGGTGQVVTRITTERKTGAYSVDVVDLVDEEVINGLVKENVLRPFKPGADKILASCKDRNNYWYGFYFWGLLMEYNTQMVKPADLPKSWEELAEPKWKDKVVVADPSKSASGLGFVKAMVSSKGWEWIDKLAANGVLVQTSGPGVHQAVLKGERVIGAPVSSFHSKTRQQNGPVAMVIDEALFVAPSVISVTTNANNPVGAELFAEYLMSKEAGELAVKYGWFSCRDDLPGPFGLPSAAKLKVKFPTLPSIGMTGPAIAERFDQTMQKARK